MFISQPNGLHRYAAIAKNSLDPWIVATAIMTLHMVHDVSSSKEWVLISGYLGKMAEGLMYKLQVMIL